jgi:hypothetical protein
MGPFPLVRSDIPPGSEAAKGPRRGKFISRLSVATHDEFSRHALSAGSVSGLNYSHGNKLPGFYVPRDVSVLAGDVKIPKLSGSVHGPFNF